MTLARTADKTRSRTKTENIIKSEKINNVMYYMMLLFGFKWLVRRSNVFYSSMKQCVLSFKCIPKNWFRFKPQLMPAVRWVSTRASPKHSQRNEWRKKNTNFEMFISTSRDRRVIKPWTCSCLCVYVCVFEYALPSYVALYVRICVVWRRLSQRRTREEIEREKEEEEAWIKTLNVEFAMNGEKWKERKRKTRTHKWIVGTASLVHMHLNILLAVLWPSRVSVNHTVGLP